MLSGHLGVPEGCVRPQSGSPYPGPCTKDQLAVLLGMLRDTFGTAITCIDGRVHPPLVAWMQSLFSVAYVDLITEPGPDQVVARTPERAGSPAVQPRPRADHRGAARRHDAVGRGRRWSSTPRLPGSIL